LERRRRELADAAAEVRARAELVDLVRSLRRRVPVEVSGAAEELMAAPVNGAPWDGSSAQGDP
jgi:hypothetical protein